MRIGIGQVGTPCGWFIAIHLLQAMAEGLKYLGKRGKYLVGRRHGGVGA